MRTKRTIIAACFVAWFVAPALAQTGGIDVRVVDPSGDPLPGATVTISHPTDYVKPTAHQTDSKGLVSFPVLRATGSAGVGYTIQIAMPGFSSLQFTDLKVRIGKSVTLPVRMSVQMEERVEVLGRSEVVDLDDTTQTTRFTDEFIQDLPVPGRFYQNVLTLAPGVQDSDGDGNPNVHGSRDRDFKAEVSGVSNVDPLTGQQMSQINPNSIEEMEVITAGAGVEFSRAQGGFARILQKQGSNEFEGVFEFYFRSSLFDGTGAADADKTSDPDFNWFQPGFQISGPFIKDRLWYRLSHEWIMRENPQNTGNGIAVVTDNQQIHSDQLTWQVSPRNKLAFQYQSDPRTIDNFGVNSTRPEDAALFIDNLSETYAVTWTAPFSPKILINTRVAWQDLNINVAPTVRDAPNTCITGPDFLEYAQCFNIDTGERSGSYPQDWDDHRQRLTVRGDATVYGGRFLGADHQMKFGLIVENERYTRELERRPSVNFYLRQASDDTNTEGSNPDQTAIVYGTFSAPEFTEITARGITWGLYAEDRLKPAHNLTLTIGARIDREEIRSDGRAPFDPEAEAARFLGELDAGMPPQLASQHSFTGYEAQRDFFEILARTLDVDFEDVWLRQSPMVVESEFWSTQRRAESVQTSNTNVSPRVAISWDPWSNGKTKVAATWGRYHDKIYLDIPLIELDPASTELAFEASKFGNTWVVGDLLRSISPAVNIRVVDRELDTPYQDEWSIQVEREVATEVALKGTYINRQYRQQLQDIDLNHLPADWGRCVVATLANPDYVTPVTPSDPDYDAAIAPGDGFLDDCIGELRDFTVQSGEGGGPADTVLQKPDGTADLYKQNPGWGDIYLVGNLNQIDYEAFVLEMVRRQYRNWQMQASYTWSTARGDGEDFSQPLGDDRSLIQDEKGYQAYDQRHVLKVSATTITPWGFRLGGSVSWQSGLPYSILLRRPAYDAIPPAYETLGSDDSVRTRTTYPTGTRNDQRNESYWDLNAKFTKEFMVGRQVNLQLTAEVFNLLNDGTYMIYDPVSETGEQVNGRNVSLRRFGRRWQLGIKVAF
jgi:hypothetical protein